jgi:hypothetical protein
VTSFGTGITTIIRPDEIEYSIQPDGRRRIFFGVDFTIEQSPDGELVVDVPDYPMLKLSNGCFKMEIEDFSYTFGGECFAKLTCPDYSVEVREEESFFKAGECEVVFNATSCQVKSNGTVFYSDTNGCERTGTIIPEVPPGKKKVPVINTHWGVLQPAKDNLTEAQHVALHDIFRPRFIGIRSNLSAFEFLRPESIDKTNKVAKKTSIVGQDNELVDILSYHDATDFPMMYLKHSELSKPARANILKNLHVPKPSKKKGEEVQRDPVAEAETALESFLLSHSILMESLVKAFSQVHEVYLQETAEPEPPNEPPAQIPPMTLAPRLLCMAKMRSVRGPPSDIVYWTCPESDFGCPEHEPRVEMKLKSPRTLLFDPPRFFRSSKRPVEPAAEPAFVTQDREYGESREDYSEVPRPKTVFSEGEYIDFGNVPPNQKRIATMALMCNGPRPVHFSLLRMKHPKLLLVSYPRVIYPGLKVILKVALLPSPVGLISDSVQFRSHWFDWDIPVMANVCDPETEIEEIE